MYVAVRSNIRSASAARSSLNKALQIALRGGAVSGLFVVAMSLFGVGLLYTILEAMHFEPTKIPLMIVGYGFGASFVALFAQLGGGIYTKAADVGADLVGKVEAGIPEDDPRNPAVIADLVGDNVGDCAGRGADLFESTAAENIGAMVLGVVLFPFFGIAGVIFPLVARSFGLVASIVGVFVVRAREDEAPMSALNRGYIVTSVLAAILFGVAAWAMLQPSTPTASGGLTWAYYWVCGIAGMVTAVVYVWVTQYYTEARYRPVRDIAKSSETGPATNIISGFAVGLEATAIPAVVVSIAILFSFWLGESTGIPGGGIYGTAIPTMGIRAVGRAAWSIIKDVRDQFRESPGIMAGTVKPDYGRTVDICTRSALREMVVPGVLAVATPIAVGIIFRFVKISTILVAGVPQPIPAGEPLGGTLMVGTIAGVLMALVLNTGGGAWDNAKKFIEAGNLGGKGSPTHKAAVVGDTVGDPFKDTAGPSLHILVKLLSTITLVIAPLLIP